MPATITYDDGSGQTATNPTVFTISDVWLAGLAQFLTTIKNPDGSQMYASVPVMLLGMLNQAITAPVLQIAPPATVVAAQQAVAAAQANLAAAIQTAVTGGAIQGS